MIAKSYKIKYLNLPLLVHGLISADGHAGFRTWPINLPKHVEDTEKARNLLKELLPRPSNNLAS